MPSFPDSVWAPSAKAAGQSVLHTHVNDAQDEIVAIEGGYRNGTAPLNSSGSTLATLSVTGTSTHVGAVTFSTYSTQPVPAVQLAHSATIDVANSAQVGLNWDTEIVDAAGLHSTATNSSRITFAQSTGLYAVGASIFWQGFSSAGYRIVRLRVNDSSGAASAYIRGGLAATDTPGQSVSMLIRVASTTDYVSVTVEQNSGTTGSIGVGSTFASPGFWAYKVSNL